MFDHSGLLTTPTVNYYLLKCSLPFTMMVMLKMLHTGLLNQAGTTTWQQLVWVIIKPP